ncbi:MAG TPA: hypothetical protein VNM90_25035 [Haliangium sp.]|nr:hypothetical protein [Haliangium sp.]
MILTRVFTRTWTRALIVAALLAPGCQADDDGKFPCGTGTCDRATEVCIIGGPDECSACVPRPAACEADATCDCLPPANDPSLGNFQCDDEGTCAATEGDLVLTCAMPRWGCG